MRIESADQFKPALEAAIKANVPYVLDVIMENAPVPTVGTLEHHGHLFAGQKGPSRLDVIAAERGCRNKAVSAKPPENFCGSLLVRCTRARFIDSGFLR